MHRGRTLPHLTPSPPNPPCWVCLSEISCPLQKATDSNRNIYCMYMSSSRDFQSLTSDRCWCSASKTDINTAWRKHSTERKILFVHLNVTKTKKMYMLNVLIQEFPPSIYSPDARNNWLVQIILLEEKGSVIVSTVSILAGQCYSFSWQYLRTSLDFYIDFNII